MKKNTTRQQELSKLIDNFLNDRLETKLKPLLAKESKASGEELEKMLEEKQRLLEKFQLQNWMESAAQRVVQLAIVTHSLKAINPNAKGTSLYCSASSLHRIQEIGSHILSNTAAPMDVVGNAAALDVYAFLRLEFEGKTILEWLEAEDQDLFYALGGHEGAREWMNAFTSIRKTKGDISSHKLSKQLYWLTDDDACDDGQYRILSPLYPTSLAHVLFKHIQHDRFSDTAKEAREAKRKGLYSPHTLHNYPGLAVQKIGGTKPQNVSQLNSERGGQNYLLDSSPPSWTPRNVWPLKGKEPLFERFGRQQRCAYLVGKLKTFLQSDLPPTKETRDKRDIFIDQIVDEFILYYDRLLYLEPGWTAAPTCQLSLAEKLFLDPGRAHLDPEFACKRNEKDWQNEICKRFGLWLNKQLGETLPMGDVECLFWSQEFEEIVQYSHGRRFFELGAKEEKGHA